MHLRVTHTTQIILCNQGRYPANHCMYALKGILNSQHAWLHCDNSIKLRNVLYKTPSLEGNLACQQSQSEVCYADTLIIPYGS